MKSIRIPNKKKGISISRNLKSIRQLERKKEIPLNALLRKDKRHSFKPTKKRSDSYRILNTSHFRNDAILLVVGG